MIIILIFMIVTCAKVVDLENMYLDKINIVILSEYLSAKHELKRLFLLLPVIAFL